ncbi:hypothetical protein IFM89_038882 [Coptis chinensis]|uniref:Uncharacterized protein n=1 Tax=Coptis chinensis TaxID=261450 RepID=A0A835MBQ1_9MAGN|nr:hypothetical protein IFM89_038882 [Coptis chinensis]
MSSLISNSGLRYRFGVNKNSGHPQAVNAINGYPPLALMPGICAKAVFSYEKSSDIWRQEEKQKDIIIMTEKGKFLWPSYDVRLKEPHALQYRESLVIFFPYACIVPPIPSCEMLLPFLFITLTLKISKQCFSL